jgi:hypothetical protein
MSISGTSMKREELLGRGYFGMLLEQVAIDTDQGGV